MLRLNSKQDIKKVVSVKNSNTTNVKVKLNKEIYAQGTDDEFKYNQC